MGWRIVGGIGRTLITAGTLILLFVAYQLWGTGLQEAKAQDKLSDEFARVEAQINKDQATSTTTTAPATTTTTLPGTTPQIKVEKTELAGNVPLPKYGDAIGTIEIPRIGITRTIVEGITVEELGRGPGHYPESPLPGQKGNVAIAGHRTTYGQPFHNIDKLENGDQILFKTHQGEFVYEVAGTEIVKPTDVRVLEDQGDNRVTLIACHPKYSLKERIIVHAILVGKPAPDIVGQKEAREKAAKTDSKDPFAKANDIDGGAANSKASKGPAVKWGLACALVWLLSWLVQVLIRRRTRARVEGTPSRLQRLTSWSPYLVGGPVFLVLLYVFFENFARLLPGAY
ncbi:class E sortase [Aquihabitans sp. G128]|uniref:class E sortase n=1 Tax=Aquihabitans sp. G128 TaxID=2849779 RepID=UPI001C245177|nr:class E sortase [Aquihabitans sp. G128]QXC60943.1 class E sortase [Aquihabitans sp. G128]